MCTSVSGVLLFAVLKVVLTAEYLADERHIPIDPSIPQECYGPPVEVNLFECCPVGPLFTEEDLALCGFKKHETSSDSPPPWRVSDCKSRICAFKKNHLLNDDETINYEKMANYLDKWSENQTNIKEGVKEAKEICFGKKDGPPIPQRPFATAQPIPCEVDKLLICLRSNIIWNCKHNETINRCKKLSDHMAKCKQYLYKEVPAE